MPPGFGYVRDAANPRERARSNAWHDLLRQPTLQNQCVRPHTAVQSESKLALVLSQIRAVMISPADRDRFLDELGQRAGLKREGDRLVRE